MAYLDTQSRPSPGSMAAVVALHGAIGAALILGLTVSGVIKQEDGPIIAIPIATPKPPPPQPPTAEATKPPRTDRKVVTPLPPIPFPQPTSTIDTTTVITQQPPRPLPGPTITPQPLPSVKASFAVVGAKPRNDPQRWVTTDDYRGNWIRLEMTGKARFRLEIAADGRVTGCTITASSGHAELDEATCALVSKRAKFQPARGSEGEPVTSSYSNAIDWQLPE